MQAGDESERDENEHQTGQIERAHELAERQQGRHAIIRDGECHGAKGTHRRQPHDDADDAEQYLRGLFYQIKHDGAAAADPVQREPEQHGD